MTTISTQRRDPTEKGTVDGSARLPWLLGSAATIAVATGTFLSGLPGFVRFTLWIVAAVLLLLTAGTVYQGMSETAFQRTHSAPGRMIEMDGYQLHVQEMGKDHNGPTVILEAGLSSYSGQWAWIQPEVASFARVVAYDRPGLGWSDPSGQLQDGRSTVRQLYAALQKAEIPGPYVLVGHSYGGYLVRIFTADYPDEVVGVVLLDSSHPDQFTADEQPASQPLWVWAARTGVLRTSGMMKGMVGTLPTAEDAIHFLSSVDHHLAGNGEMEAWGTTVEQVHQAGTLGERPLIVLSAGAEGMAGWYQLQEDLAALSNQGEWRIAEGTNHYTLATERSGALQAVDAIGDVWSRAQSGGATEDSAE